MTCAEAREALLEADLSVLRGAGDTPLALHLRDCASCLQAAQFVLQEEALLARGLIEATPPLDLGPIQRAMPRKPWYRRSASLPLLPLAAAAALAGLLLSREPDLPGTPYSPSTSSSGPDVVVPEGTTAAVIETANPDITVVWLF